MPGTDATRVLSGYFRQQFKKFVVTRVILPLTTVITYQLQQKMKSIPTMLITFSEWESARYSGMLISFKFWKKQAVLRDVFPKDEGLMLGDFA